MLKGSSRWTAANPRARHDAIEVWDVATETAQMESGFPKILPGVSFWARVSQACVVPHAGARPTKRRRARAYRPRYAAEGRTRGGPCAGQRINGALGLSGVEKRLGR